VTACHDLYLSWGLRPRRSGSAAKAGLTSLRSFVVSLVNCSRDASGKQAVSGLSSVVCRISGGDYFAAAIVSTAIVFVRS
jgi:hypothetical protein